MTDYITEMPKYYYKLSPLEGLVRELEPFGGIIAGGCVKDYLSGKEPKDIDVFFPSEELKVCAELALFKNTVLYQNENCTAYDYKGLTVETIKTIYGSWNEVLDAFDFTVSQFATFMDKGVQRVAYHPSFFRDLALKRVVIENGKGLSNPLGTLNRAFRYAEYGYLVPLETRYKIAKAVLALKKDTEVERFFNGY